MGTVRGCAGKVKLGFTSHSSLVMDGSREWDARAVMAIGMVGWRSEAVDPYGIQG